MLLARLAAARALEQEPGAPLVLVDGSEGAAKLLRLGAQLLGELAAAGLDGQLPLAALVATVDLDRRLALADQDVFTQRGDPPVVRRLGAAIATSAPSSRSTVRLPSSRYRTGTP